MEQDAELSAMSAIISALDGLSEEACARVIRYAAERKGVALNRHASADSREDTPPPERNDPDTGLDAASDEFPTFADLYYAASPKTGGEKALVAGYWLQFVKDAEDFGGAAVNKELQHVGDSLANVTDAFNQLMAKKPKLAIQTRKSGKSQQARKLYKLTEPGKRLVEAMLKKGESE